MQNINYINQDFRRTCDKYIENISNNRQETERKKFYGDISNSLSKVASDETSGQALAALAFANGAVAYLVTNKVAISVLALSTTNAAGLAVVGGITAAVATVGIAAYMLG
jgi:hypothetical protein